jgi:hypothetical protein
MVKSDKQGFVLNKSHFWTVLFGFSAWKKGKYFENRQKDNRDGFLGAITV